MGVSIFRILARCVLRPIEAVADAAMGLHSRFPACCVAAYVAGNLTTDFAPGLYRDYREGLSREDSQHGRRPGPPFRGYVPCHRCAYSETIPVTHRCNHARVSCRLLCAVSGSVHRVRSQIIPSLNPYTGRSITEGV